MAYAVKPATLSILRRKPRRAKSASACRREPRFIWPCIATKIDSTSSALKPKHSPSSLHCVGAQRVADACMEAISSNHEKEVNWAPKIQAWFQNWAALGLALSSEMNHFVALIRRAYEKFAAVANYLQAPLLLAVRVFFLLAAIPSRQRQAAEHR